MDLRHPVFYRAQTLTDRIHWNLTKQTHIESTYSLNTVFFLQYTLSLSSRQIVASCHVIHHTHSLIESAHILQSTHTHLSNPLTHQIVTPFQHTFSFSSRQIEANCHVIEHTHLIHSHLTEHTHSNTQTYSIHSLPLIKKMEPNCHHIKRSQSLIESTHILQCTYPHTHHSTHFSIPLLKTDGGNLSSYRARTPLIESTHISQSTHTHTHHSTHCLVDWCCCVLRSGHKDLRLKLQNVRRGLLQGGEDAYHAWIL